MIALAYSLTVSYATGYAVCRLLWPQALRSRAASLLMACLSFGAGTGITSCMYFWWLASGAYRRGFAPYAVFEAVVMLVLLLAASAGKKRVSCGKTCAENQGKLSEGARLIRAALVVSLAAAAAVSVMMFVKMASAMPHGEWDAYSIWNQHARFMSRQPGEWMRMFDPALARSHPDYPLMLPSSVARCWMYSGSERPIAPQCLAFLFMAGLAVSAVSVVSALKGAVQGLMCGLALLSASYLIQFSAFQYADIPLAYFILASVSMYLMYAESGGDGRPLLLAGLMAALAAWTKNEGIAFFAVFGIALFIMESWRGRFGHGASRLKWFLLGALPVILTLVYFKSVLAPQNDIIGSVSAGISGQDAGFIRRITDLQRYGTIAGSFVDKSYLGGLIGRYGMIIYLLVAGIAAGKGRLKGLLFASAVYAAMIAVYFMTYLLSPQSLKWYIFSSMERLLAQLLPVFLVAFFIAARSADDILSKSTYREGK